MQRKPTESFADFKQRRKAEQDFLKQKRKGTIFYNPYCFAVQEDGSLKQLKSVSYKK